MIWRNPAYGSRPLFKCSFICIVITLLSLYYSWKWLQLFVRLLFLSLINSNGMMKLLEMRVGRTDWPSQSLSHIIALQWGPSAVFLLITMVWNLRLYLLLLHCAGIYVRFTTVQQGQGLWVSFKNSTNSNIIVIKLCLGFNWDLKRSTV